MRNPIHFRVFILLALVLTSSFALAHSGASGVVKMRMEIMSGIADQMKSIGKIIKGEEAFNADTVQAAAQKIETHADHFEKMFPKGSIKGPSEALLVIWEDWNAFAELGLRMKVKAAGLAEAAQSASQTTDIATPFIELGATCKNCHKSYRKKKE